ncbi:MAG: sugar transferase [Melioribacteraceae bacterium]|nr:sugar transferase [Melioribacteraceae bacterium]
MRKILSYNTLILELILYSWVYFFFYYVTFNSQYYEEKLFLYLGIQFVVWFLVVWLTHSFKKFNYKENYYKSLSPFVNSYILFLLFTIPLLYLFSFSPYVVKRIYFSSTIYTLWSFVFESFRYFSNKPPRTDEIDIKLLKATTYPELEELSNGNGIIKPDEKETEAFHSNEFSEQLKKTYLAEYPSLFEFISSNINLGQFKSSSSIVIRSADPYNINVIQDGSIEFLINLHELNDIRRINQYFINLNEKLTTGGIYVGKFEPTRFRYRRFLDNYPSLLARLIYFYDFIWRRVTPKLPVIKRFYFAVTRGKDRSISLAEGLGRLYYSGFEVLKLHEYNNFIVFIAKKIKTPSTDSHPSYGPMFKMKRVGKNGNDIFVYKLRTMHPYSEYLQKFVFDRNSLDVGGKIKDDFRITTWGAIFRKLWIDELPMFINYFKREMKLVGVRPISSHYYSLYPKELQEKRIKTKPGLVPPFYVDMPKTMDEIVASELKYLAQYEKAPIKTDVKYFFQSWYNILIKRARSG